MGVWGTAIFSDDAAADARDVYRDYLENGLDARAATDKVLEDLRSSDNDLNDDPSIWLGLAAAQIRLGRLEDRVRDRALQIIADGSDLGRWADQPKLQQSRRRVLAKLETQLRAPQRAPTKIRRSAPLMSDWVPGDIMTFHGHSQTWLLYVQGIATYDDRFKKPKLQVPLVSVLDLPFEHANTASKDTPYLHTTLPQSLYKDCFYLYLARRDYKSTEFSKTGVSLTPTMTIDKMMTFVSWVPVKGLDDRLLRCAKGQPLL